MPIKYLLQITVLNENFTNKHDLVLQLPNNISNETGHYSAPPRLYIGIRN